MDRTKFHKIAEVCDEGQYYQLRGVLRMVDKLGEGRKQRLVATLRDDTGSIELVWFQGINWVEKMLVVGKEFIVYGKPTEFNNRFNFSHPDIESAAEFQAEKVLALQAVYPSTEKCKSRSLDSRGLLALQKAVFTKIHPERHSLFPESLPQHILTEHNLTGRYNALLKIHFPRNEEELAIAKHRLKFEELFYMQMRILRGRSKRHTGSHGHVYGEVGEIFNKFYKEKLPFDLTNAQKRVLKEIRSDCATGRQMNRLVQGDVGSGKTVVALMAMLLALDNGFQSALMAPTEILAQQHYKGLSEMLGDLGPKIAILTGSTKAKERRVLLEQLKYGAIDILIGTHALLEDPVVFHRLGMSVIDEQHRFGVAQRARLWAKGADGIAPHILVMTATPIPRTLAMTLYGDLDVSVIDELPPGRKPITTLHKYDSHRLAMYGFVKDQISRGRQAYMVFPLIEEKENTPEGLKDLMAGYENVVAEFPPPQYQVSIVHGQMKAADKEFEMARFARNETQIMVATTVIEVGVNVPNASVMVIENAERFGLSQLHQLRGRVGRGAEESYCLLMSGFKLSADGKERINTMVRTQNGFEIAEVDLKLRGPGNIEGTQQSGLVHFRLADLAKDQLLLQSAREAASQLLESDPHLSKPEHLALRTELQRQQPQEGWGRIS